LRIRRIEDLLKLKVEVEEDSVGEEKNEVQWKIVVEEFKLS
jgi:hypothetical protein